MSKLTLEEADKIIAAVMGEADQPSFATNMPAAGDVGVILKANGGVEILSVLPSSPDQVDMAGLGLRGLFAVALYKLAHQPELMRDVLMTVSNEMGVGEVTKKVFYDA